MILAGDIGGTNARLAFFQFEKDRLNLISERTFPSREYEDLGGIVLQFVKDSGKRPEVACFGIPGPVHNGRVETSNLPWVIEQSRLGKQIQVPDTILINDLEATAWGVGAMGPEDLKPLNAVSATSGNQAVIAAGTGLGEAGLVWDGSRHQIFACEGGHTDFGPQGTIEIELLQFLAKKFGHVSYERIVCGPGLVNVYDFLSERNQSAPDTEHGTASNSLGDAAASISSAALNGTDKVAVQALDLWMSVYGAEAGNLALKTMATGGIFLGGGIAPKIFPKLAQSSFMKAFIDKGRLSPLLKAIPVKVIMNDKAGLLGAARCAATKNSLLARAS